MSDANRVGDQCWYMIPESNRKSVWVLGTLRAWSTDHQCYESGVGAFPVGVVEDRQSMRLHSIHVERIAFQNPIRKEQANASDDTEAS